MRWVIAWSLFGCLTPAADSTISIPIRGRTQTLVRIAPQGSMKDTVVIFLPGDRGWHGTAVTMGQTIASWGYEVYGFDTKKYLEGFSETGVKLSPEQLASDMRQLAAQVESSSRKAVVLIGWSQGAGMALAAVAGVPERRSIRGVITLGLPETAVLGWDWKATLASAARREPDQPKFEVKSLLPHLAPTPVWMIQGSNDEYTAPAMAQQLYRMTSEPKHWQEISGANHRFDGHQDELFRSIEEGLGWIAGH